MQEGDNIVDGEEGEKEAGGRREEGAETRGNRSWENSYGVAHHSVLCAVMVWVW